MADSAWEDILNSCNGVSPNAKFESADQILELWQERLPVSSEPTTYPSLGNTKNSATLSNLGGFDHQQTMFESTTAQRMYGSHDRDSGTHNLVGGFAQFSNLLQSHDHHHHQEMCPSTATLAHLSESCDLQQHKTVRRTQLQRENHILAERLRREEMNEKFSVLRSFVPKPIKKDKASIVGETIDYVIEMERTLKRLKACKADRQGSRGPSKLRKSGASDSFRKLNIATTFDNSNIDNVEPLTKFSNNYLQKGGQSTSAQVDVQELGSQVIIKVLSKWRRGVVMQLHLALDECKVNVLQSNVTTVGDNIVQFTTIEINPGVSASISEMVNVLQQACSTP
eukprot:Gb_10697 [translate_table: standard]